MRGGPRLSSEAQCIDTFVSFIQHGASTHRLKFLFRLKSSRTETVSTFFDFALRDRRFKLAEHVQGFGCCNWHVINVICAFLSRYNPIRWFLWVKYNQMKHIQYTQRILVFYKFLSIKTVSLHLYNICAGVCSQIVTYQVLFSFL